MDFLPWNLGTGSSRSQDLWHKPPSHLLIPGEHLKSPNSTDMKAWELQHRGVPGIFTEGLLLRQQEGQQTSGHLLWAVHRSWEPATLGSSAHGRKGNVEEKEWVLSLPQQTGVFKAACV